MRGGVRRRVPRMWRGDVRGVVARNTGLQLAGPILDAIARGLIVDLDEVRYRNADRIAQ